MVLSRLIGLVVLLVALVAGSFGVFAWSEIPAIDPPKASSFDTELVRRGARVDRQLQHLPYANQWAEFRRWIADSDPVRVNLYDQHYT